MHYVLTEVTNRLKLVLLEEHFAHQHYQSAHHDERFYIYLGNEHLSCRLKLFESSAAQLKSLSSALRQTFTANLFLCLGEKIATVSEAVRLSIIYSLSKLPMALVNILIRFASINVSAVSERLEI